MMKNDVRTAEMNLQALPFQKLRADEQRLIAANQQYPLQMPLRLAKTMYEAGFHFDNAVCSGISRTIDVYLKNSDINNLAILAVGSSGRFDGSGIEQVELVVLYHDPIAPSDLSVAQIEGISGNLSAIPMSLPWGDGERIMLGMPLVELKYLHGNNSVCIHSKTKKAYPGRAIEGTLVYGNGDVLLAAKKRAFAEINNNKQVIDDAKDQQRAFRKAMESGTYRQKVNDVMQDVVQVDLDAMRVLIDPEAKQFGLKYGIIRYTQTRIAQQFYNLVRSGKMSEQQFVELPPGVEERLRYAARLGWAKDVDASIEITNGYMVAVGIQNMLKIQADRNQAPSSIDLDFHQAFDKSINALKNDVIG